ncbi:Uncharacterized protein HZ326_18445 [Fusarium oxysporum f. sp. albedinis]|nr:Uncharacterized protein HZ326_18445 [Fusarium oxysporum f. sp. albedinis]
MSTGIGRSGLEKLNDGRNVRQDGRCRSGQLDPKFEKGEMMLFIMRAAGPLLLFQSPSILSSLLPSGSGFGSLSPLLSPLLEGFGQGRYRGWTGRQAKKPGEV